MAKHKHKQKQHHRNAAPRATPAHGVPIVTAPKKRRRIPRGEQPSFWTAASAIAGGLGGAVLGGWANRKGYDPRIVGTLIAGAGGLGAWKLGGNARIASYGFAAAGAGDSLLKWLDKDHEKKANDNTQAKNDNTAAKPEVSIVPAQTARNARRARNGGGLDGAFNRVRERLHQIYEDDADGAFVEEGAA